MSKQITIEEFIAKKKAELDHFAEYAKNLKENSPEISYPELYYENEWNEIYLAVKDHNFFGK